MNPNNKLTLTEIINFEKELELLEKKLRIELGKEGVQARIFKALRIDRAQLSGFKNSRRSWSVRRMIEVGKEIVKNK